MNEPEYVTTYLYPTRPAVLPTGTDDTFSWAMWGALLLGFLYLIFQSLRTPPPAPQVAVAPSSADQQTRRKRPIRSTNEPEVVGVSDLKPGMKAIVCDELSEFNDRMVTVERIDGSQIQVTLTDPAGSSVGSFAIQREYLKREARVKVDYAVHNLEDRGFAPEEPRVIYVPPFATLAQLKERIAAELQLKPHQFHLIQSGEVLQALGNLAASVSGGLLRVFVRKETLAKGYRAPAPADPKKTEAYFRSLEQRCEEMERGAENIPPGGVLEGDSAELLAFLRRYDKVVVDFHASWCGPCRAIAPTYSAIANSATGKAGFFKIDADLHKAAKLRYKITAFPTFISFRNGVEHARVSGADERRLDGLVSSLVEY
eukprot:TRINITY_DN702_c0_g1_i1.p1 TRINITY_DN702_c0_g1~~TRINITY_DN702_c0_g1_i1.p1  ORF type:complete len:406 (+),score=135.44 TRINITY_DN702_c0_g1_i1:107-1219(+)